MRLEKEASAPEPEFELEAADDPNRRRSGWMGLLVAAASFMCGLVAASLFSATYAAARGLDLAEAKNDLGAAIVSGVGLWVGFLVLPLVWARWHGGPVRALGLTARWVDVPLGLVVGIGTAVATVFVSTAVLTTGQQDALDAKAEEVVNRGQGPVAAVVLVLALCVFTPLAEEVYFRGLLFRSLHRAAGLVAALVIGGLFFGIVHYDGEPASGRVVLVQIGMLSAFGLALCALAARTGRIAAGIVAHAAFNSITVLTLLAQR